MMTRYFRWAGRPYTPYKQIVFYRKNRQTV